MTVKLIGFSQKYIGESTDVKPVTGGANLISPINPLGTIPQGSTFYEGDTGRTATWNGYRWTYPPTDAIVADRLDAIIAELREMKELHLAAIQNM